MKKRILLILVSLICAVSVCGCALFRSADGPDYSGSGRETETEQTAGTSATEETPATSERADVEPASVSFLGCGDNIVYYGNVRDAQGRSDAGRTYGFKYSYEEVASYIASADVAFINQETLMCGDGYEFDYYPTFNGPQDMGYDLCELGFDVVNLANNHMLDKTGDGLVKTMDFWKTMPVLMIGGYDSEEDFNTPRYLESNGLKIAFLSYTYGTNGFRIADGINAWIPYLGEEEIKLQTAKARENADVVIVSVHWGEEGAFSPSEDQKKYASLFAECGVDAVIGHHPHVVQPVEWIDRPDGGRMLCVYSLGNFMAEQAYDYNMVGAMIQFNINRASDGKITIENPLFIPTVFDFNYNFYENRIHLMENYTEAQAAAHGIGSYGNYTSLERLRAYVTDTVSAEFLPDFLK